MIHIFKARLKFGFGLFFVLEKTTYLCGFFFKPKYVYFILIFYYFFRSITSTTFSQQIIDH